MKEDVINFDVDVFSLETIKRALYRFSDKCSFDIQLKEKNITVLVHSAKAFVEAINKSINPSFFIIYPKDLY